MFGNGEGLNTEIKFVVASAYVAFTKTWGDLQSEKLFWVDRWSEKLKEFDTKTIGHAIEHCVQSLSRSPSLPEFRIYCQRILNKERLTDPIISKVEVIARKILEKSPVELGYSSYSELADACLIAASIASAKANEEVDIKWDNDMIELELVGRARMFGAESLIWHEEAKKGKGYWFDFLHTE